MISNEPDLESKYPMLFSELLVFKIIAPLSPVSRHAPEIGHPVEDVYSLLLQASDERMQLEPQYLWPLEMQAKQCPLKSLDALSFYLVWHKDTAKAITTKDTSLINFN